MLKDIQKLIREFERHGGKFQNAEVRHNELAGFHCHAVDNSKDILISCPANLLVDIDDVDVHPDGLFIKKPEKYGNKIDFLNRYFALQFNGRVVSAQTRIKRQIQSLSEADRKLIANIYSPKLLNIDQYKGLSYERKRIIDSHNIEHFGKKVLMPFVSFINFHKDGGSFDIQKDAISIKGKYNGEIVAKYNDDDVLKIASGYNFITDTKYIYSIPLTYQLKNGKKLIVNTKTQDAVKLPNGFWKPLVENQDDFVKLSWFPLYLENAPMYPAIISRAIADEIKIPAENLIYNMMKLNLHALVPAAFKLTQSNNEFARFLGDAAKRQLETLAATRI